MSQPVGIRGQTQRDVVYASTVTVGSGGGHYLVWPEHRMRSFLEISTTSASGVGYISIGAGEATATISGGVVTSVTVVDGGFNYTIVPTVAFLGGGNEGNTTFLGCGAPGYEAPGSNAGYQPAANPGPYGTQAYGHAVISGGVITSIVVDWGGAGYACAPFVQILNNTNDPNGVADPFRGSVATGRVVTSGNPLIYNMGSVPTSPVALYCATSGAVFLAKYMV